MNVSESTHSHNSNQNVVKWCECVYEGRLINNKIDRFEYFFSFFFLYQIHGSTAINRFQ